MEERAVKKMKAAKDYGGINQAGKKGRYPGVVGHNGPTDRTGHPEGHRASAGGCSACAASPCTCPPDGDEQDG